MKLTALIPALLLAAFIGTTAQAEIPRTPSPADASVAIVSPLDGEAVTSPFNVVFAVHGMTLAPAGGSEPNSGHHHLLIDTPVPTDLSKPLPADSQHLHFGKAQTETEVTLAPGRHTLQLILGDANHIPHEPPVISKQITITVR